MIDCWQYQTGKFVLFSRLLRGHFKPPPMISGVAGTVEYPLYPHLWTNAVSIITFEILLFHKKMLKILWLRKSSPPKEYFNLEEEKKWLRKFLFNPEQILLAIPS